MVVIDQAAPVLTTTQDLISYLQQRYPAQGFKGLLSAIETFEERIQHPNAFERCVLPFISRHLSTFPQLELSDLTLARGQTLTRVVSVKLIWYLLSNAFILNLKPHPNPSSFGAIEFHQVYSSPSQEARERVCCLIAYFFFCAEHADEEGSREVEYSRVKYTPIDFSQCELPVQTSKIKLTTEGMEAANADYFVDFANKKLHIHRFVPSCTQEEVLFSMCPEALPAIMLFETLLDTEIAVIKSVKRVCKYSGYLRSFRFEGLANQPRLENILAMDAVYCDHFEKSNVDRDINKAHHAFKEAGSGSISTGHWGCGAFGGDKEHKFVQQVLALSAIQDAPVLHYSVFHEEDLKLKFQKLLSQFAAKHMTVRQLYQRTVKPRAPPKRKLSEAAHSCLIA